MVVGHWTCDHEVVDSTTGLVVTTWMGDSLQTGKHLGT